MGHYFDAELNCNSCDRPWHKHQRDPSVCPRKRKNIERWISDPVRSELDTWIRDETVKLQCEMSRLEARRELSERQEKRIVNQQEEIDRLNRSISSFIGKRDELRKAVRNNELFARAVKRYPPPKGSTKLHLRWEVAKCKTEQDAAS